MDFSGLLSKFGGQPASPSLYNSATTGGASGPGYVGDLSPDQFQGLLSMGQQLHAAGQPQQQQQAPMPQMNTGPTMQTQMPQSLYPQQQGGTVGLLRGHYGY